VHATRRHFVPDLSREERRILTQAVKAGGSCSVQGLSAMEMLRAAATVLVLQRRGLVNSWIHFSRESPGQPEMIPVEITADGRRALAFAQ
jgi:hypothetical protein